MFSRLASVTGFKLAALISLVGTPIALQVYQPEVLVCMWKYASNKVQGSYQGAKAKIPSIPSFRGKTGAKEESPKKQAEDKQKTESVPSSEKVSKDDAVPVKVDDEGAPAAVAKVEETEHHKK